MPQIMDYPSHYTRLMPMLAFRFVARAHSDQTLTRYRSMVAALRDGDQATYLGGLAEMHAVACAVKSFGSWSFMSAMEQCRRLMGGHAFHAYLGIGRYLADSAVGTTGGGDNNVLVKQTGMYLVKTKKRDSPLTAFLFETPSSAVVLSDFLNPEQVMAALSQRCRNAVQAAKASRHALALEAAAEHWHYRNVFAAALAETTSRPSAQAGPLLEMWKLCALDRVITIFADLAADKVVAPHALAEVRRLHEQACLTVRENALALVDAFGVPDEIMRNPLISRDGQGYEHYVDAMRANRFNREKVAPYWKAVVGPKQKPENFVK